MSNWSKKDIQKLHQKYAQGIDKKRFLELIWTHSEIVAEIAIRIARHLKEVKKIRTNSSLLEAGSLVHDIGVYECFDEDLNPDSALPQYISHGYLGYQILKKEGYPEELARFALTHIGTGITREDIKRENLPFRLGDYIPITLEEEIVCYADKFHTKYPSFNSFKEQKRRLEKFEASKGIVMGRFKKKFGIPDLSDLEVKYKKWQEGFDHYFTSLQKNHQ